MDLAALRAPTGVRAVLLDLHGHQENVDLLDNPGLVASGTQSVPAVGANLREEVIVRGRGKLFGQKGQAFVLGVSGLSADRTIVLAATVAWSCSTVAVSVSTCPCKRSQLAQAVVASFPILSGLFLAATPAIPFRRHCFLSHSWRVILYHSLNVTYYPCERQPSVFPQAPWLWVRGGRSSRLGHLRSAAGSLVGWSEASPTSRLRFHTISVERSVCEVAYKATCGSDRA